MIGGDEQFTRQQYYNCKNEFCGNRSRRLWTWMGSLEPASSKLAPLVSQCQWSPIMITECAFVWWRHDIKSVPIIARGFARQSHRIVESGLVSWFARSCQSGARDVRWNHSFQSPAGCGENAGRCRVGGGVVFGLSNEMPDRFVAIWEQWERRCWEVRTSDWRYWNPSILLLDEATSALDSGNQEKFLTA